MIFGARNEISERIKRMSSMLAKVGSLLGDECVSDSNAYETHFILGEIDEMLEHLGMCYENAIPDAIAVSAGCKNFDDYLVNGHRRCWDNSPH